MIEFVLSFLILTAVVLGMAVGVLRGRPPIAGTCGGLNNAGSCELCGGNPAKCEQPDGQAAQGNFVNAASPLSGKDSY